MDALYALKRLFTLATEARKAAKVYYGYRADPKTDALKKQYLADSKHRECDLDSLLVNIPKLFPQVLQEDTPPAIPRGALSVAEINTGRLGSWTDKLNIHDSTAQVLVGVGIGSVQGRLIVLCTEDLSNDRVILFLEGAIRELRGL